MNFNLLYVYLFTFPIWITCIRIQDFINTICLENSASLISDPPFSETFENISPECQPYALLTNLSSTEYQTKFLAPFLHHKLPDHKHAVITAMNNESLPNLATK